MIKYKKEMKKGDGKREFDNATNCHICGKRFSETDRKVKDHSEVLLTTNAI